jgi:predicted anti-sigma-YlaC factor YlaD
LFSGRPDVPIVDVVARIAFGVASVCLMLLAGALIVYAGVQVGAAYQQPDADLGSTLLEAVGYTIIAIAVFDVGKYLLEEEAIRAREMSQAGEARRSMTKFISTIAIAVFLESLVAVFEASKTDVTTMIYPTFLLFGGVALIVGLGVYQRLSASTEKDIRDSPDEEEADAQAGDTQ